MSRRWGFRTPKCARHGPSGSGKSTLLRCANRLEEIQGGEIRLEGQSISAADADINRLRQRIGMVFQSFNLFPHRRRGRSDICSA